MINEYGDSVKEWFLFKNGNTMTKIKDRDGVVDEGISKQINSQAAHLSSYILSHSKRLLNDVILAKDRLKRKRKEITPMPNQYTYTRMIMKY